MIASEERRVRVSAPSTRRSTVRPKLPPAGRPTLSSALRPTHPAFADPPLPTTLRLRMESIEQPYSTYVDRVPDQYPGEHRADQDRYPAEASLAATECSVAAGYEDESVWIEEVYADTSPAVAATAASWEEDAAPLRTSPVRRRSRWLYAVSRQVLFGTPRHVVASACVIAAFGLLGAGGSLLMSSHGTLTPGLSASHELEPRMPLTVDLTPPRHAKFPQSVNRAAASAPPEVIEDQAAPTVGAVPPASASIKTAAPADATAELVNPAVAEGARLDNAPGDLPMPPIGPPGGAAQEQPTTQLVAFESAPFPYTGLQPSGRPFLDIEQGGRKGHRTWYGVTLWQEQTFNDRNVLMHVPAAFDPARPGVIVVFFHGYGATLTRDILARQQVPAQISASGANAVLLAPQFAVDARDSSAGRFWEPGGFNRFLDEAAKNFARLRGDPSLEGTFAKMPVVIVGYSGGFLPAAWALKDASAKNRVRGVLLLDAVYGELDEFTDWTASNRSGFFVSAYTRYTQYQNAVLRSRLAGRGVPSQTKLDGKIGRGNAIFLSTGPEIHHADFVTQAWTANPIKDVLSRLPDISLGDPQTVASIDH